ncbi:MAG: DUF3788 domain-containing protein [Sedimentisphaerales bacterium]|nr:DUF3788 domain-containing protein [Sedimentisphaerales bacterium]
MSIFDDKSAKPDERGLAEVLGRTFQFWNDITKYVAEKCGDTTEEWGFPGPQYGWSLRVKHRKRTIIYLTPCDGFIRAAFVFGEKAVAAVEESTLPRSIKEDLRNATKYAEGRGIRLEVRKPTDVSNIKKLIDIKTAD